MSSLMDGLVTNRRCWGHRTCHSFGRKHDVGHRYQRWVCVSPALVPSRTLLQEGGLPAWAATTGQLFTHKQAPSPNTPHESGLTAIWISHKPLSYLQTARVWPECLHSPSSTLQQQQVHEKGQIYIKIVLKPLGKVGVNKKKVAGQHK